jgi:hypothetical protein
MGRLATISCLAGLATACLVAAPRDPFGGVTGDPDESEASDPRDTDPFSTISESAETTVAPTTSGVVPDTGTSGTGEPGSESGPETATTIGEASSSSGGAESSSTTGAEEIAMCASLNTLTACAVAGGNSLPYMDDMLCTTAAMFDNPEVYDFFVLDVSAGACVFVEVDNAGGDADVMAYVVDSTEAYYGLETDYSELDDEIDCTTTPWNDFACPSAGVTAAASGPLTIAVGQWGGTPDCTDNAPYTLWVSVDGTDIDMTEMLVLQDHVIDPLTCP